MTLTFTLNSLGSIFTTDLNLSFTGSISGFVGNSVQLSVDTDDDGTPNIFQEIIDGGEFDADGVVNGSIALSFPILNPYATAGDFTGKICVKDTILSGEDIVFVIDRSGSARSFAGGWTNPVDFDGDGRTGTVFDLQLAGLTALVEDVKNRGLGDTAKMSVAFYDTNGGLIDFGGKTWEFANTDLDGNGRSDILDKAYALTLGNLTNFEAGLQQAITAVQNAGTAAGNGTVIFSSDGVRNAGGAFTDEADFLRTTLGQNLRAVGIGSGARLTELRQIDPDAVQILNADEYLDFLTGGTEELSACNPYSITVNDPIIMGEANVKPESNPSPIKLSSRGKTPMAIYGSRELDVNEILRDSVLVNSDRSFDNGASGSKFKVKDINNDGIADLLFKVKSQDLANYLSPGATEVFFTGDLSNGTQFLAMHDNTFDPLKIMA